MNEARQEILKAANDARDKTLEHPPYRMRHLQRAVFVVRQKQLVDAQVLEAAGFRAAPHG